MRLAQYPLVETASRFLTLRNDSLIESRGGRLGPAEGTTMDDRKEKRNLKTFLAMLSSATQPLTLMLASTENVSSGGMRVQTDRPWEPDTRLLVETSESERSARARVIYCETLSNTTFAVGLEFSE